MLVSLFGFIIVLILSFMSLEVNGLTDFTFPTTWKPPCLALITEPDACDSLKRMEETFQVIQRAVSLSRVDLVSVRLQKSDSEEVFQRAVELTRRLVTLSNNCRNGKSSSFRVVCSSDWVEVAVQARAHGIHVKEMHLTKLPEICKLFSYPLLIGTSVHSVESATSSYSVYQPHYYFVGTCFPTETHPEKTMDDLEGPRLPGQVSQALQSLSPEWCPKVFAIGGIDESNCDAPIQYGADGVAVIRSIMQAENPSRIVSQIHSKMATTSVMSDSNSLF
jgi:thiamine-phosphate pyrophosphorylase